MRKYVIFSSVITFLFLFANACAIEISDYTTIFKINPNGNVNEEIGITLKERVNETMLNYIALGEISDFVIKADGNAIDYILEKSGSQYNVMFHVPSDTKYLNISFVAKDIVFMKGNVYGFFANLRPPVSDHIKIYAYLPKGFALYGNLIYPESYNISSDGEHIYIKWAFNEPEEDISLSFKFYNTNGDFSFVIIIVICAVFAVIVAYTVIYYRKKVKEEFLKGFTDDERKVLLALSERGTCMQNKLEKELGFSRAKMARIVKKLESKGLVTKERIGRTNRLFCKK
ncbi:MAG: MarR family transcriptional regulator [Candidatus Aenigmarchaeota archaeon]|nr:MarR family transcriptional regulator [Candidatus Aenigmarchaeota archaeon]